MATAFQRTGFQDNAFQIDAVASSIALPDSFAKGGATRKQLKKHQAAEDKFQRRKRELEEVLFGERRPSLKNTAEQGGPKAFVWDDEEEELIIMMLTAA